MVQAPIWEVMTRAMIRALLYCKDVVGVYGKSELAVLAAQCVQGGGYTTITIDGGRDSLDMPFDLASKSHIRVGTSDPFFAKRIMERTKGHCRMKIIFGEEATKKGQQTLQWTCQHESSHPLSWNEFPYHARDNVLERRVHHVLQIPGHDLEQMPR